MFETGRVGVREQDRDHRAIETPTCRRSLSRHLQHCLLVTRILPLDSWALVSPNMVSSKCSVLPTCGFNTKTWSGTETENRQPIQISFSSYGPDLQHPLKLPTHCQDKNHIMAARRICRYGSVYQGGLAARSATKTVNLNNSFFEISRFKHT